MLRDALRLQQETIGFRSPHEFQERIRCKRPLKAFGLNGFWIKALSLQGAGVQLRGGLLGSLLNELLQRRSNGRWLADRRRGRQQRGRILNRSDRRR